LNLLRSSVGKRGLRSEKIYDAPDALAVTPSRYLNRLLSARQKIISRRNALLGSLERVIGHEYLCYYRLARLIRER
jgi:hypothetical protein